MNKYPVVVTYKEDSDINVLPFLVEAVSQDEALGLALRIGKKNAPKGAVVQVAAGNSTPVTYEGATICGN